MATVTKQTVIDIPPSAVWDALRDWGALHKRLAPGFVTDLRLEEGDRVITMFNGAVVRERLVAVDEHARRLVWSIIDGPYAHHNASAQILPNETDKARFVWTADFLPNELAARIDAFMERGLKTIKDTLEAASTNG